MKGQERLTALLGSYTPDTMPRSILLVGHTGSGRHTLVKELAGRLKFRLIDISECDDFDTLRREIDTTAVDTVFLYDCSRMSRALQGKLLKSTEEPGLHAYMVGLAESRDDTMDTLVDNRCQTLYMDSYSPELLRGITGTDYSDTVYSVYDTPGLIQSLGKDTVDAYSKLADKVVGWVDTASYANTLSIADKYDFRDDRRRFCLFLALLKKTAYNRFVADDDDTAWNIFTLAGETLRETGNYPSLGKAQDVVGFLSRLWEVSR